MWNGQLDAVGLKLRATLIDCEHGAPDLACLNHTGYGENRRNEQLICGIGGGDD